MTAQYSQANNVLPSNLMVDVAASAKISSANTAVDGDAFSSALDNASKNYADKSEVKTTAKSDNKYSEKNKDVKSAVENTDTSKRKEVVSEKTEVKADVKTEENSKAVKEQQTEQVVKEEVSALKEESAGVEVDEVQPVEENEQTLIFDESKTVDELLEQIKNNVCVVVDDVPVETTPVAEAADDIETSVETVSANKIVNEKLLSNIEYESRPVVNVTDSLSKAALDNTESLPLENQIPQIKADTAVKAQNIDTDELLNVSDTEPEVTSTVSKETINNVKPENNTDVTVKTAKESLAADTSRLTVNIEQDVQEEPVIIDTKPVTPLDTKQQESDLEIKVTDEVASQVRDNNVTGIENKDTTSKVKDKAVETMTALKDKDTTVVDVKTSNSDNNTESSLSQNNANETVAKLNVQNNNVVSAHIDSAESFVNKLDTQLSMNQGAQRETVQLNQNDILSQMNAKFEQLQQQSSNKVSIVLQPESLGKVSVEIMNTKEGIVAKMTAENHQVKELFDKSLESLKSSLAAQGVNVNSIKVESAQESSNNAMDFERNQFEQAFNNQQNGQNHSNKSQQAEQVQQEQTASFSAEAQQGTEEVSMESGIDMAEGITNYNGKVDYIV